ncbi:BTAD domain-containing putative transcriptional regulator [Nocardiopsis sp. LOL_012]|uniref:AfsR/SARP family transcriptional regulator n=1 Tax=Nocardiopsis sp. LOL_012 TaxID=3345409 RepID=UPI003A866C99
MAIEISVLGGIEARIDGARVDLGHARRQSVFLGLLADVNRPVAADRLIDRVWGQSPPDGARSSLYSYVSRLRTAWSTAGERAAVGRRSGGYVLALSEDAATTVDLHRFRELTARGRASADEGTALAAFDKALGLWRSDTFGTLDTPWVNELRESLRLERFRAELDRNDLLLRQGRQTEILSGLLALAREHPLDERLTGQLMLTLYREGRAAQALERYECLRRSLSDEIGTGPGAELRDLHSRILDCDPVLDAPAPPSPVSGAGPAAMPVPSQLPCAPPLLTGREEKLDALDPERGPGASPITVVSGMGGVGKTSLALWWAHDRLDRFPDGQLYVNLHGFDPSTPATQPHDAIHDCLSALGVDRKAVPAGAEARVGLYRSLIAGKRMLVLLDDARDAEQVRPLLPGTPSCTVVITSRDRLNGLVATEGAHPLTLGPLTRDEAHELLAARLGRRRVLREPEAVETVIECCERLPLALAIAAAHAAGAPDVPLAELASELQEAETRLDVLDTGELGTSVRSVFDASHRALPAPAARLLGLLGLAPGLDIGLHAVAALAGLTPARTRTVLRTLQSAHLVQQPLPGRYALHDLVRLYARERAEREGRAPHEALRGLVDFYTGTAEAGNRFLGPHDLSSSAVAGPPGGRAPALDLADRSEAFAWYAAELPWLLAVIRLAEEMGLYRDVWRLSWDTHLFFRRCGRVEHMISAARAGLDAAGRMEGSEAPVIQALAHRNMASSLVLGGRNGQDAFDHLCRALALFEDSEDLLGQAHTHQILTHRALLIDEGEEALRHAERSLKLYRSVGERFWEASALNTLGCCLAEIGRYASARERCQAALDASVSLGFAIGEAASQDSLGQIADLSGRHAEAVGHYGHALRTYRMLGDAYEEANTLHGLAKAQAALGESEAARVSWERALVLFREQFRGDLAKEAEERLRGLA